MLSRFTRKHITNILPKQVAVYYHPEEGCREDTTLYVHWPFCRKICPYCNFNKYVRDNVDEKRMSSCLKREFVSFVQMYDVKTIKSIYFGGGSPSLASPSKICSLIDTVHKYCKISDSAEITIEVNPTSTEKDKLMDFKHAGINRVSIGIQALNDSDLKILGREHSVSEAICCLENAQRLFNNRISLDLMFGRPHQTVDQWTKELKKLLLLNTSHVSLYQLTLKSLTPMEKSFRQGKLHLPSEEEVSEMYHDAVNILSDAQLVHYEVSNFAKKGYKSVHNMSYWKGNDYIGIGPGAHGRLTTVLDDKKIRHALVQTPVPEKWMDQVERKGHGIKVCKVLNRNDMKEELILLGLRMCSGIEPLNFLNVIGRPMHLLKQHDNIRYMLDEQLLIIDDSGLRATSKGMHLLDSLTAEISLAIDNIAD